MTGPAWLIDDVSKLVRRSQQATAALRRNMNQSHEKLNDRQTELETLVTHLQRIVQDLDEVVRQQHGRLDLLQAKLARLETELGQLRDATTIEQKPEDEKPPHY